MVIVETCSLFHGLEILGVKIICSKLRIGKKRYVGLVYSVLGLRWCYRKHITQEIDRTGF
jgi:hypothetical protein